MPYYFYPRQVYMAQETPSARFASLAESIPPIIPATELPRLLGGLFTAKTLANRRWQGLEPKAFKLGHKVFHRREDIISWISETAREFNPD